MEKKRINIIGGNIAGLSSAYYLAKKNYDVHVYERKFAHNKVCGDAVSEDFANSLKNVFNIVLDPSALINTHLRVSTWNKKSILMKNALVLSSRYTIQSKKDILFAHLVRSTKLPGFLKNLAIYYAIKATHKSLYKRAEKYPLFRLVHDGKQKISY